MNTRKEVLMAAQLIIWRWHAWEGSGIFPCRLSSQKFKEDKIRLHYVGCAQLCLVQSSKDKIAYLNTQEPGRRLQVKMMCIKLVISII